MNFGGEAAGQYDVLDWMMFEELYGGWDFDLVGVDEDLEFLGEVPFARIRELSARYTVQDRESSVFWSKYIAPTLNVEPGAYVALRDDGSREGMIFRRRFRVPYSLFEFIVEDVKRVHNIPDLRISAAGVPGVDVRLLVLGSLRVNASGCTFDLIEELTNVAEETIRTFYHDKFSTWGDLVSGEYIKMPGDEASYRRVERMYSERGLPGCAASVDCVHILWDRCPASLRSLCANGKEKGPTLVFEVAGNHRRRIMHVSQFFWGTVNDKNISRVDNLFRLFREPGQFLSDCVWEWREQGTGTLHQERGAYMISDGGYNAWRCLVSPYKHQLEGTDEYRWSKRVESVRKDVECIFGVMKKRFLILKHPVRFHDAQQVERVFVTCAVIHNLLMDYDGLDDINEDDVDISYNILDRFNEDLARAASGQGGGVVAGVRSGNQAMYGVQEVDAELGRYQYVNDATEAEAFRERRDSLISHFMFMRNEARRGRERRG